MLKTLAAVVFVTGLTGAFVLPSLAQSNKNSNCNAQFNTQTKGPQDPDARKAACASSSK